MDVGKSGKDGVCPIGVDGCKYGVDGSKRVGVTAPRSSTVEVVGEVGSGGKMGVDAAADRGVYVYDAFSSRRGNKDGDGDTGDESSPTRVSCG
jgi:hypothetical protein